MSTFTLVARGLLNSGKDDNEDKHVCPVENTEGPAIVPFVGDLTFHQFASILSGACAIVSTIMVLVLIILHAINYSNPVQQRQIIRILCLIPWVAIFSFLIVWQETAGEYLDPSLDVGCSVALSAFLLFMCDLVLSHREGFDSLFGAGAQAQPDKKGKKSPMSFKRQWYSVLQFIPTSIIVWIATAASLAAGTYCKQSNSVHFAHIWLTIITAYSMVIAIIASLVFYKNHKKMLQKHNIILKLAAFKGVLGLNFLQSFIISILSGHGVLKPTQYMTFHDINTGLASLLLACEMPLFAILLVFAFSPAPYRSQGPPAASPFNAIVDAINISDILSAFIRGPMRLVRDQQRQILRQNSMRVDMDPSSGDDISYEHSRV